MSPVPAQNSGFNKWNTYVALSSNSHAGSHLRYCCCAYKTSYV